jgi:hypothetical protein
MNAQTGNSQLQNYLGMPEVQTLLQDIALPEANVQQWIANLMLLNDIPFQNIIADTRLAPQESLRFFYVDPTWIDAMIDGVLSVGNNTSLDAMFTEVMAGVTKAAGAGIAATIRAGLLGIEPDSKAGVLPDPDKLMVGLLFRSVIVADWPGMHVIATASGTVLTPIRFEKIGADIILIIYGAIPDTIVIQQPSQALEFGVMDNANPAAFDIYIRGIGQGSYPVAQVISETGNPVTFQPGDPRFFRAGNNNVVNVTSLLTTLQGAFPAGALSGSLTPSEFALQMVKTPEEVTYTNKQS